MYLLNEIINIIEKNKTKKIAIFVDMDGVVADYRFGEGNNIKSNVPGTYSNKRPIETTINNLKQIHEKTHCEMFILSSCLYKEQANEKKVWLNINMPFIKADNMIFVITDNFEDRKKNKVSYLRKKIETHVCDLAIMIDDTHEILFLALKELGDKVIPFHVITLID